MEYHDPGTLSSDFGRVHFAPYGEIYKYRPFLFTLNRITYRLGNGRAQFFRMRNVLAHLLATAVLYFLALQLFRMPAVAGASTLLFALHPMVNQPVAMAIAVNVPADFGLLLSLLLFVMAVDSERYFQMLLTASMVVAAVSILTYDPVIVVFGIMFLYLGARVYLKGLRSLPKLFLATFAGELFLFAAAWLYLRAHNLPPGHMTITSPPVMIQNIAIYAAAFFQFIDPVLANQFAGTPLPPEFLHGDVTLAGLLFSVLPVFALVLLLLFQMPRVRQNLRREDWVLVIVLLLAWAGSLVPFLFYSTHASETYVYVGLIMLSMVFSRLLYGAFTNKKGEFLGKGYAALVLSLGLILGMATWVRNGRVKECGDTVTRIWEGLPGQKLASGAWHLLLSNVPDEPASELYGIYGWKGVDTLGYPGYGELGVEFALKHAYHNSLITAQWAGPRDLSHCSAEGTNNLCFWVHSDGKITPFTGAPPPPEK